MVRTQIQLTPEQSQALKEASERAQISVAALIREAIDLWLRQSGLASPTARRRAAEDVPSFSSGVNNLAERHDDYLAEQQ